MHSQGILQFYLHTPRSSANRMNHAPAFSFPAKAGTHLPTPEGWKAELALDDDGLANSVTYKKTIKVLSSTK